jgi:hypothetical protein
MAVEVRLNRFYCTTSGSEFGPTCRSQAEAEILLHHVWRTRGLDIRALNEEQRDSALEEVRSGFALTMDTHSAVACLCGSGKPWLSRSEKRRPGSSDVTVKTVCVACHVVQAPQAEMRS